MGAAGVPLAALYDSLRRPFLPPHAEELSRLEQGGDFDKEFVRVMVAEHEKAVALFERAAGTLGDADLKAYAEKTLPTLRHHLEMARSLARELGVTAK